VVPRKLDPSDPTVDIPCLVRQMRPLSGNPGLWAPAAATPVADEEILLEGVTGFQIDASLDGGKTWLVQDGLAGDKKWSTIRTAIDTAIKASKSPFVIQARGVDNPKWAAYTPILFRIDLETRTRIQRSEYSKTGPTTAAFRTRRETLMLSPRNFALSEF
jgi:hypothetical protein